MSQCRGAWNDAENQVAPREVGKEGNAVLDVTFELLSTCRSDAVLICRAAHGLIIDASARRMLGG